MSRRGALLGSSQQGGGLPSGYTSLNYLQGQGSQYIDTGIIPLSTKCEVEFDFANNTIWDTSTSWCVPIGAYGADDNRYVPLEAYNNNSAKRLFAMTKTNSPIELGIVDSFVNNRTIEIYNDETNQVLINGIRKGYVSDLSSSSQRYPIGIFAYHSDTWNAPTMNVRIYYLILTNKLTGKEIWHGVPALDPNGKPCMLDMVSRQPFYNAGTGDFLYG